MKKRRTLTSEQWRMTQTDRLRTRKMTTTSERQKTRTTWSACRTMTETVR